MKLSFSHLIKYWLCLGGFIMIVMIIFASLCFCLFVWMGTLFVLLVIPFHEFGLVGEHRRAELILLIIHNVYVFI